MCDVACQKAEEELGISIDLIDLRSMVPLDVEVGDSFFSFFLFPPPPLLWILLPPILPARPAGLCAPSDHRGVRPEDWAAGDLPRGTHLARHGL